MHREAMASARKENATHPVSRVKEKCELKEEREKEREKKKILAIILQNIWNVNQKFFKK